MILYYFEACPFCQKVLKIIKELDLFSSIEMRDIQQNDAYRKELLALTEKTQVPCLVIDGDPMLESDDIVSYLKKKFSDS